MMTKDTRLGPWLALIVVGVGAFLVLPALIVVPSSFSPGRLIDFPPQGFTFTWYANFFETPRWFDAGIHSVRIGILTALVATTLGTLAALGVVRYSFRGRGAVNSLLIAPIIVPLVILAISIYNLFLRINLVGTTLSFVIAHTVLAVPFVVIAVSANLQTLDPTLDRAAASLGAGPLARFWLVTFPLIRPAVLSGALFAFLASFDEVVIAIFLASPRVTTLPVQMWSSMRLEYDPTLAAVSSMLMLLALVALVGSWAVQRSSRRGGSA